MLVFPYTAISLVLILLMYYSNQCSTIVYYVYICSWCRSIYVGVVITRVKNLIFTVIT